MSEGINVHVLAVVRFWMLSQLSQSKVKTHSLNGITLVHGIWSGYLCSHSIWKDMSSVD